MGFPRTTIRWADGVVLPVLLLVSCGEGGGHALPDALDAVDTADTLADGTDGEDIPGEEPVCPDHDGDGHTSIECGGDDCDDGDPDVHPGVHDGPSIVDSSVVRDLTGGHDIAIDPSGTVHVVYLRGAGELWHATLDSGTWNAETIGESGYAPSMAIDSEGRVAVVYTGSVPSPGRGVRLATNATGAWTMGWVQSMPLDDPYYPELVLASGGTPHVVYGVTYDYPGNLVYTTFTSGAWAPEFVSDHGVVVCSPAGIALDGDVVHVAYPGQDNEAVHAVRGTGGWTTEVAAGGEVGSAFVAAGSAVHIAYSIHSTVDAEESLRYATDTSGSWADVSIDEDVVWVDDYGCGDRTVGWALDASGVPHAAFHDDGIQALRYATIVSGAWRSYTIDAAGDCGWLPAMALAGGLAHLLHLDWTTGDLRYVAITVPDGLDDDCDTEIDEDSP